MSKGLCYKMLQLLEHRCISLLSENKVVVASRFEHAILCIHISALSNHELRQRTEHHIKTNWAITVVMLPNTGQNFQRLTT